MPRIAISAHSTETLIQPSLGWKSPGLAEVWSQRQLLLAFVVRDIKARYRQTWIGVGWAFLQPALTALFFTVFLGPALDRGSLPYPLFVFSGFVAWNFYSAALVNAAGSVVNAEALIKRIYYPRLLAPLAAVGACLIDLVVAITGIVILACIYGYLPTWSLLWLPVWVFTLALCAAAAGTFLAALSALYRDVRHLIPFLVQLALFATPVVFLPHSETPLGASGGSATAIRWILITINPLNALIAFGRAAIFAEPLPWSSFAIATGLGATAFVFACLFFRRVEDQFADVL